MEHLPEALYRAADTRAADLRAASEHGLAGSVLMERAGSAAYALLRERFPRARRITVVCGPGNNGGDGYVLARLAKEAGLTAVVLSPADTAGLKGDTGQEPKCREAQGSASAAAASACTAWHKTGGTVQVLSAKHLQACDVLVDALFGTGLERPPEGEWRTAIEAMNASGRPIFAMDTPSGLHADSGRVLGVAVRAALTLSFIGLKAGLFTGQGRQYSGLILFDDLGVPDTVFTGVTPLARRITPRNLHGLLAPRARHAHKGDAGRVLVVGGQPGMPGAVRLTGEAAYRAGAGLVVLATHPAHAGLISAARPELIAYGVNDAPAIQPLLAGACAEHGRSTHALAVGPGLGQGEWGRALWQAVLAEDKPLVVDADALNLLAAQPTSRADWVLTPHPGEAARLLGVGVADIQSDRFAAARAIAQRYGGVCVLKGSGTLIAAHADQPLWLCDRGNPGLATGGSGDVLAGAIAAFLAQGLTPIEAARLGVWAHASAGDRVVANGERGIMASDLLVPLREAINTIVTHAA
ncbi:MAG TPA: NAD(P)H-hydrate dehydratase [Acidiferrobacterales bacterium]|nr:NAD(P)H-hydrate dehydratase [Acidiferrobacterales bacterium]